MAFWSATGNLLQPLLGAASSIPGLKIAPKPVVLPTTPPSMKPTSLDDVDKLLTVLDKKRAIWVGTPCDKRAEILKACVRDFLAVSDEISKQSVSAKGSYGSGTGEESFALVPIVLGLKELENAMRANGQPKPRKSSFRNGRHIVEVFPMGMVGLLFGTFRGEVWIEPGKEATQGRIYREKAEGKKSSGGLSLVLGAGNQTSVPVFDFLHKLFVEDEVVIVKMNPVNEYLGPLLERAFKTLIDQGFLAFAYGGVAIAQHLVNHPLVTSIHLTGSEDTYNAIAWGSPTAERKGKPKLNKTLHGELGNMTPYVIVPGPWSKADMYFHADQLVAGKLQNSSHNCCALEVLVMPGSWTLREQFLSILKERFNNQWKRQPWYPGSAAKYQSFKQRFPKAHELGADILFAPEDKPALATLFAEGVSPDKVCGHLENWCACFQEVVLPFGDDDPVAFMAAASSFVNNKLWGSLCASVFIHPETQRSHGAAFESMLADLKYGTICVNSSAHLGYGTPALPWGAYPGNTQENIGSGNCQVHNTFLFDHPEKGVLRGPWTYAPTPSWVLNNTCMEEMTPYALKFLSVMNNVFLALYYITICAVIAVRG